jgi:hypothetical protein
VFPHPNHLPRWLNRLLLGSGTALLVTGLAWDALHYGRGADTLPSPGEHWLMRAHGLAVLAFVVALGGLGPVHVPRGWRQERNRGTGATLLALAAALLASGYALYYFTGDASRDWVGILHAALGTALAALVLWHRRALRPRPSTPVAG